LNVDEIARYHEEGFVIPKQVVSKDKIDALCAHLERLIEANPGVPPERLVSIHIEGKNAEGITGSSAFFDLARDPVLLDAVEAVIGPDIILWGCQAFCKPPRTGMEVPFHQDGHYWPIRPLATCTVWVALDPSTRENGCLRVIPRSHSNPILPHYVEDRKDLVLNQAACPDGFDERNAIDLELQPGEFSMHDVGLIHGSKPNTSDIRRAGIAIRYMPSSSHFIRDLVTPGTGSGYLVDFSTRPIWLLRGNDKSGRNDFQVGHGLIAT